MSAPTVTAPSMSGGALRWLESNHFLWVVCLLFVVPRALLIAFVPVSPFSDFGWYFNRATEIAAGLGYQENGQPTAYWPIGYPALLAGLFAIVGPSLLAAKLLNLVLQGATLVLLYRVAVAIFEDKRIGRLAVLLLAVYPNNVAYVSLLATEPLYSLLLLLLCLGFLREPRGCQVLIHGLVIGIATLVKTQTSLLAAVLVVFRLVIAKSWEERRQIFLRSVVAGLCAIVTVLPWTVRNYLVLGSPVFVSTNGGMSLLVANNPSMVGLWDKDFAPDDPLVEQAAFSVADQISSGRRATLLALRWMRENPIDFISIMPQKVWRLWAPDGEAEWSYQATTPFYHEHAAWFRAARIVNQAYYAGLLILAGLAFLYLMRNRNKIVLIGYVAALYFTILSMIFSGQSRYHAPLMPLLIIYASWFAVRLAAARAAPS